MSDIMGIYVIKNNLNGRSYVGASKTIHGRMRQHHSDLNTVRHKTKSLQTDWLIHGAENFTFGVLQVATYASELNELEEYWMNSMERSGDLYNSGRPILYQTRIDSSLNDSRKMRELEIACILKNLISTLGYSVTYSNFEITLTTYREKNFLKKLDVLLT